VTIPAELNDERDRRLANQRLFRQYYVKCSCERGCYVWAYTSLVTKAHARRPFAATS
jgi:hypothetical protein